MGPHVVDKMGKGHKIWDREKQGKVANGGKGDQAGAKTIETRKSLWKNGVHGNEAYTDPCTTDFGLKM